ncbi:hypothetical protein [Breoghania sp.]|uniref:hypothetical protein n=1 Tax=Breoghania sp. TaxID=2065378 RepID=UPI002AA7B57C|nr:hypothetical protein [Breoghania sp.]
MSTDSVTRSPTETIIDYRPGRGSRYPFYEINEGDVWIALDTPHSESIQNSFHAWAKLNKIGLKASRSAMTDGRVRITFKPRGDTRRRDTAKSFTMKVNQLQRRQTRLVTALDAMGRVFSSLADTPERKSALELARSAMIEAATGVGRE